MELDKSAEIPYAALKKGTTFELGTNSFSEEEIITYAKKWDPLPFHTSVEAGNESMFRGVIASGPQIFHEVHKSQWLPRFGHSVLCGLGVNNWKFKQPVYPDKLIKSQITILDIQENKERQRAVIVWYYEFLDPHLEPYQSLEMTVLHKMG